MLTANSDFQFRLGCPSFVHTHSYQLAYTFLIQNLEGIILQDTGIYIIRKELPGIIA